MGFCGQRWQPRRLDRVVQTLETSTRVSQVSTDEGLAFVKGMGNPAGLGSLVSELVCAELATWFGLRVPDFAIVQVDDLEIPLKGVGIVQRGPAFASRTMDLRTADGTDTYLSRLRRPQDLAKLVLFDTWVRNADRCPPSDALDPTPNYENLTFAPIGKVYDVVAIDHTHCFTDGELTTDIGDPEIQADGRIYGFFPEFPPFLENANFHEEAARLGQIDDAFVRQVVQSIPQEWGITLGERNMLADAIIFRAQLVSREAPRTLVAQLGLDV
jgi:hypothetical protein